MTTTTETAQTNTTVDQAKLEEVTQTVLAESGLTATVDQAKLEEVTQTETAQTNITALSSDKPTTVLPAHAILDFDISHRFDTLVAYQKFHGFTLRNGEVKVIEKNNQGIEVETLYNVTIIGSTIEKAGVSKTNTRFFTSGDVFMSPKDRYYSHVGSIVEGALSMELDTERLLNPKVKQFLASQIQLMLDRQFESTKLKDKRNLKAANHLKSLIRPRAK